MSGESPGVLLIRLALSMHPNHFQYVEGLELVLNLLQIQQCSALLYMSLNLSILLHLQAT